MIHHVHGGSILLRAIADAGVPGVPLDYTEVLCQGPLVGDEGWSMRRARFLAAEYDLDVSAVAESNRTQDLAFVTAARNPDDEVVLWFGAELFCQAIYLRLLALLPAPPRARVTQVVRAGDDRYCGVSRLTGERIHEAFTSRVELASREEEYARTLWTAVTAPRPSAMADVASDANAPLPLSAAACRRWLEELPGEHDGLARSERAILRAISNAGGSEALALLYPASQADESQVWMTDMIFLSTIRRLAAGPGPLLEILDAPNDATADLTRDLMRMGRAALTPVGERVLAGKEDWMAHEPPERWVGGTRVLGPGSWRWDEAARTPRAPS